MITRLVALALAGALFTACGNESTVVAPAQETPVAQTEAPPEPDQPEPPELEPEPKPVFERLPGALARKGVRDFYYAFFEDMPPNDYLNYWGAFVKRKAYQLQARRGYSFENAVLAAFARFEEHFWDEPAVKAWREALEQEELNDWLEESMPTTDEIINGYPEDCDSPPFC